jgi:type IV secretory pathway VirB10-like protein
MKKFLILAAVVMLAVPVSGCSTGSEPAPTVTVTAPAPEREQPAPLSDEAFLSAVRGSAPELARVSDLQLVDLARTICLGLDAGVSIETVLETGINSGLGTNSVAAIAAGAIVFYCPDQESQLNGA